MSYNKEWYREYYKKNREAKLKYENEKYRRTHDIKPRSFSEEKFQSRLKDKYGDKLQTLTPYINFKTEIKVRCTTCGYEWNTLGKNLLLGRAGCKKCSNLNQTKSNDKFKEQFITNYGDRYELLTNYINANTKVKVRCKECNNEWESKPYHLSHTKCECPKCSHIKIGLEQRKTHEQFIWDVYKKHNDRYEILDIYTNAKTKLEVKCNRCENRWKIAPYSLLQGVGCPICKQSKGEEIIETFLKENQISFIRQYTFPDCKNKYILHFDFYLPNHNICIEYDGIQHYKILEHFGGIERFEHLKLCDGIKNNYCKKNKIKLLRIPYHRFKNIRKILTDNLK